jgi:hypothetical protein
MERGRPMGIETDRKVQEKGENIQGMGSEQLKNVRVQGKQWASRKRCYTGKRSRKNKAIWRI